MAAEIGILLVHGIGTQARGDTLVIIGDPLFETLKASVDLAFSKVITDDKPGPASDDRVGLVDAFLNQDKVITSLQGREPPHAKIQIAMDRNDPPTEWILAECHWADLFPPPKPRAVTVWMMQVLPWICVTFVVRRLRMARIAIITDVEKSWRRWHAAAYKCGLAAMLVIALPLINPLVIAMELFLIALLVLALVPIKAVHDFVQRINAALSGILGDSFVFASSEMRQRAVTSKLASDIAWLGSKFKCKHIVLVAHSQGAAVSYLTLKRYGLGKVRLLVTFGAGIVKLHQLGAREGMIGFFAFFPLMAGSFALFVAAAWTGFYSYPAGHGALIWLHTVMAIFFAVLVVFAALIERTEQLGIDASEFERQGLKWIDLYASKDPVPNGPIFLSGRSYPESVELCNELSLIGDHTSYSKNRDEFLPFVVKAIAEHSGTKLDLRGLDYLSDPTRDNASCFRRIRIASRNIDQSILNLALIAFLFQPDAVKWVGSWLIGWINEGCTLAGITSRWKFSALQTGLGIALVVYILARMFVQATASILTPDASAGWYSSLYFLQFSFFSHLLACGSLSLVSY